MTNPEPAAPAGEIPLSAPYYGASLGVAFSRFWRKYATFSGRASRSEFWWWYLIGTVVAVIFYAIGGLAGGVYGPANGSGALTLGPGYGIYETLSLVWGLATIVPTLALTWRRLHDSDHSGGFFFLFLIPLVGDIILLVFFLTGARPAGARFDN